MAAGRSVLYPPAESDERVPRVRPRATLDLDVCVSARTGAFDTLLVNPRPIPGARTPAGSDSVALG